MTDTRLAPAEVDVRRVQRRTVALLMVSQALGGVGVSSGVAVATLLAEDIPGSAGLAGLAQTSQVLGAASPSDPRPARGAGYRWANAEREFCGAARSVGHGVNVSTG